MFNALFTNITTELINAIRRTIIARVQTAAFNPKNINIIRNTTDLDNDQIRHRLSMIPVEQNDTLISLNVDGPQKVFSETIKTSGWIYPKLYLFDILENQSLEFTALSSNGCGVEHARHCNVTNVRYVRQFKLFYNKQELFMDTLLDIDNVIFKDVKTRLPELVMNNKLVCNKLFIDTNIIDNINELIYPQSIQMIETDNYTLSFETINNVNAYELYNTAIDYLVENIQKSVINDQSIANLLVYYYNKNDTTNTLNIYREHPTSEEFSVKCTGKYNLSTLYTEITTDLNKLKFSINNNEFNTEKIKNIG